MFRFRLETAASLASARARRGPAVASLLAAAALLALAALPSCGLDPGQSTGVPCGSHAECPPDRTCYRGYCVVGAGIDAGIDAGIGAGIDGGPVLPCTPVAESCANAGHDDDCNGVLDDVMTGQACEVRGARGICRVGVEGCGVDGAPICVAPVARTETCDSLDDDCDGDTDEGFALDRDPLHCGACGHACEAMGSCVDGECCGAGATACRHECVDLQTDEDNCGRCDRDCGDSETCTGGCCCRPGRECRCP